MTSSKTRERISSRTVIVERLDALLRSEPTPWRRPEDRPLDLIPGEAWMDALIAELTSLPVEAQRAWELLLRNCSTATGSAPTAKWLDAAAERIHAVGEAEFVRIAAIFLERIGQPGSRVVVAERTELADPTLIDERQADLLRGLVWSTILATDERLLAVLGRAAEASRGSGARPGATSRSSSAPRPQEPWS